MKGRSFLGRLRHYGYLMHSYSLMKALGLHVSTVLERILTERQHAIDNELHCNGWFNINSKEIAFHIGLSLDEVAIAISKLVSLNLVEIKIYSNNLHILRVKEEELLNFVSVAEQENDYKNWNYYLFTVQAQILTEGEGNED